MAELKTRIQLRYDSYANWSDTKTAGQGGNLVLKAGEVGICTIPGGTTVDGVQNPPHVMFKVGDGTSAFSTLSWTSAKAADVYAWAKQAALPINKIGDGNVVSSISWNAEEKRIDYVTASVATSEGLANLTARVKTIEDTYATDTDLSNAVKAINEAIALKADKTYVDTELGKKVNNTDFNTFKTDNTTAINAAKDAAIAAAATETQNQIAALDVPDAEVEGQYVTAVSEVDGKIAVSRKALPVDNLETGSANGTVAFNGTDVAVKGLGSAAYKTVEDFATAAQGTKADSAVQKVTILGHELTNGGSITVEQAKTDLDLGTAAYKNEGDFDAAGSAAAVLGATGDAATANTVYGAKAAAQAAQDKADANEGKLTTLIGTDADKSVRTIANEELAKQLIAEGAGEALDTLQEIAQWIQDHPGDAAAMNTAIENLEALVGTLPEGETSATIVAYIQKLVKAEEDRAKGVEGGLDTRIATLEGKFTGEGSVSSQIEAAVNTEKERAEAAEKDLQDAIDAINDETNGILALAKADAQAKIEALDVTDTAVAGQYVSAVQQEDGEIKVSRATLPTYNLTTGETNGTVKFNDTNVAVAGLGSAAYTESSAYATAAQGTKANTALQAADITTGSANGSIAVKGTNVAVKGLGSAAYTESSAYATAAQGTKADNAVQNVKVGSGLTVTTKDDKNEQTISLDESVIFVLNGGTSTTVI